LKRTNSRPKAEKTKKGTIPMSFLNERSEKLKTLTAAKVLPHIDFARLCLSYETKSRDYAKIVLGILIRVAKSVYGSTPIEWMENEFLITVPGVVRSKKDGRIFVCLLTLSGKSELSLMDVFFLTGRGVFDWDMLDKADPKFTKDFGAFEFATALSVPGRDPFGVGRAEDHEDVCLFLAEAASVADKTKIERKNEKRSAQKTEERRRAPPVRADKPHIPTRTLADIKNKKSLARRRKEEKNHNNRLDSRARDGFQGKDAPPYRGSR
jgi:hypothetical protein